MRLCVITLVAASTIARLPRPSTSLGRYRFSISCSWSPAARLGCPRPPRQPTATTVPAPDSLLSLVVTAVDRVNRARFLERGSRLTRKRMARAARRHGERGPGSVESGRVSPQRSGRSPESGSTITVSARWARPRSPNARLAAASAGRKQPRLAKFHVRVTLHNCPRLCLRVPAVVGVGLFGRS